jgi:spore germination protein KC
VARLTAVICLLAALLTLGCNGGVETDEVAFVVSVGIDAAPGGQFNVTYRLARPAALGGGAGGGDDGGKGGEAGGIVTITAPSLAVARDLLNSQVARVPSMAHAKVFVVGEELARKGIGEVVGPLLRFREFRGSMFVFVADGTTAEKVIRANRPTIEKLPARWIEGMMASAGVSGYYPRTFLHDFYMQLKAGSGSPSAVLMGLSPQTGESAPAAGTVPGEKTEEYLAGGVPVRGGNPAMMIGTALFRGDRMVGKLTSEETRMLAILTGDFRRGYITVQDPLQPAKGVNVYLRPGRNTKIGVGMDGGRLVIDVDVMLEGEISAIGSGVNYEAPAYNQLLEEQIAAVIRQDMMKMIRYTQQVGSDPANLGKYVRPMFRTYDEYRKYDVRSKYREAEVNVRVTVQVRRTGLMRMTSPIRGRE